MLCLALDTGCRVDELLTLQRTNIDMDNLLIKVYGKGSKERVIPISLECRKILYKFLQRHSFDLCFVSKHGGKVYYRSALDQLKKLGDKVGVSGLKWHTLRHSFATAYIRDGGNAFYLQKLLGHSDIQTTQIYVKAQIEDLSLMHKKISLLTRLGCHK